MHWDLQEMCFFGCYRARIIFHYLAFMDRWTEEQTIVALYYYCIIPFNKATSSNPTIAKISQLMGRSHNSLKMKIGNFGSLDPELRRRGIVGLGNTSRLDEQVWDEYSQNWEKLASDAEEILAKYRGQTVEESAEYDKEDLPVGKERMAFVKTRINQSFFRKTILASYENKCAVTGLPVQELLVASHIVPWAKDEKNRLNPTNGICLNALHDRAFDKGLMTITPDYKIKISKYVLDFEENRPVRDSLLSFENKEILLPSKFYPNKEFLEYHNNTVFVK